MSVLFVMAQTASGAERYEDACHYMHLYTQELEENKQFLKTEEGNLLNFVYRRASGSLRNVIKTLNQILKDPTNDIFKSALKKHKKEAHTKLTLVCNEILKILEETIIPAFEKQSNVDALIHYRTMAGDYHRYLSETVDGSIPKAGEYYALAYTDAQYINPASVVRLGVANNYAVYCYEVLNDKEKACSLSKTAADAAAANVDTLTGTDYKVCMSIIQFLIANFKKWSTETTTFLNSNSPEEQKLLRASAVD
jgi:14-3-3 protein epsilon